MLEKYKKNLLYFYSPRDIIIYIVYFFPVFFMYVVLDS